ncbi:uncharacterized protein L201_001882 [Kwoniella dendrophila CBS 6074]|uniref:Zn(2)-C6 fungal-type domain-containing protein n=1 Tax=Kwoniella dendrophila CBS 6074 TaxID=1295534 RepID=A0AAX4JR15_9TREE
MVDLTSSPSSFIETLFGQTSTTTSTSTPTSTSTSGPASTSASKSSTSSTGDKQDIDDDDGTNNNKENGKSTTSTTSTTTSTARGKTGCITCRLRKKRCDEAKPICETCSRLGIECMGYGAKRPKWLRENDNAKKAKQNIKKIVLSKRSKRGRQDDSITENERFIPGTSKSTNPSDLDKNHSSSMNIIRIDSNDNVVEQRQNQSETQNQEQSRKSIPEIEIQTMDIDDDDDDDDEQQKQESSTSTINNFMESGNNGSIQRLNQTRSSYSRTQPRTPHFWELGSTVSSSSSSSTTNNNNITNINIHQNIDNNNDNNVGWNISTNDSNAINNQGLFSNVNNPTIITQNTSQPISSISNANEYFNSGSTATHTTATTTTTTEDVYPGFFNDPSIFPPPPAMMSMSTNEGSADISNSVSANIPFVNDLTMDTLWGMLFGPQPPPEFVLDQNGSHVNPNEYGLVGDNNEFNNFTNIPSTGLSPLGLNDEIINTSPNLIYLHHYLNVVLPIQYRVMGISISMGDLVAPLALKRNEVLTSVSSLAALHMVALKTKKRLIHPSTSSSSSAAAIITTANDDNQYNEYHPNQNRNRNRNQSTNQGRINIFNEFTDFSPPSLSTKNASFSKSKGRSRMKNVVGSGTISTMNKRYKFDQESQPGNLNSANIIEVDQSDFDIGKNNNTSSRVNHFSVDNGDNDNDNAEGEISSEEEEDDDEEAEGFNEYSNQQEGGGGGGGEEVNNNDKDVRVAKTSHQQTMERLRFISPSDLTAEEIIVSVLFAVSYHLFCGGTSKHLKEILLILQRCLSAALYSSPELNPSMKNSKSKQMNDNNDKPSPWSRYRILIEHMVWTDIIASVTRNQASTLLPMYRKILDHSPSSQPNKPVLLMDKTMGCDSTTLLALCETVALSEWKDRAEAAGCLSYKELLDRSKNIEKILSERAWRESHLDIPSNDNTQNHQNEYSSYTLSSTSNITSKSRSAIEEERNDAELRRTMSDVFHGSVKVLLAVTINGPFPRVPEIASAVVETMEALNRLDIQHSNLQIHRAVVLPITIAGCHCETLSQQDFFRNCFDCLGPEAKAFGNTGPALELMEQVWKKRNSNLNKNSKVDWRQTMFDLGWENGILLI